MVVSANKSPPRTGCNIKEKMECLMMTILVCLLGFGRRDKAAIIKDAIDYIKSFMIKREGFKRRSWIWNLENQRSVMGCSDFKQELPVLLRSKKKKLEQLYDSGGSRTSSIEVLEEL